MYCFCSHIFRERNQTDTVASVPAVTDMVLMKKFRFIFWDSVPFVDISDGIFISFHRPHMLQIQVYILGQCILFVDISDGIFKHIFP